MYIIFALGIIIGILVCIQRNIQNSLISFVEKVKEFNAGDEKAQFFEPVSDKEAFKAAKNINDLLKKQ